MHYKRSLIHPGLGCGDKIRMRDSSRPGGVESKVLGFQLIGNRIHHIKRSLKPNDPIFSIYPGLLNEVNTAYMTTSNGVAFELFEFPDPKTYVPEPAFEYHRGEVFHVCVTDSDPDSPAESIVKE
ncbi:hypothetical protein BJX64DRAFT_295295 [Aspergillus heterothallicus]